jgi:hypothetical protein
MYRKDNNVFFVLKRINGVEMKSSQMMNGLKLTTALLSCFTMVFSPVAMGAEAERISRQQLEKFVVGVGLNRKETLGQFWDKSKVLVPANLYADLQKYVNENRNLAMPEVTGITSSKGADGTEVPTLQMSQGGKTYTVQFFGEKIRYIRINGVTLAENDLIRLRPALARLEASDINVRKLGDKLRQDDAIRTENEKAAIEYTKDFARFKGFPRVTPQMWKSMSKFDRANYIVKMRLMWQDAARVNSLFRAPASMVPKKKGAKDQSLIEKMYEALIGPEAYAETSPAPAPAPAPVVVGSPAAAVVGAPDAQIAVPVQGTTVTTSSGTRVRIAYDAEKCVVAGYVGSYGPVTNRGGTTVRPGCSLDLAIATYANATANGVANNPLAFVREANDNCARANNNNPRYIACNPIIYGYPNGTEICVNRDDPEFQTATWFDSQPREGMSCDVPSRLGSSASVVTFTGSDYSNAPARSAQLTAIEADQRGANADYALTKTYLQGVLTKRSTTANGLRAAFDAEPAVWTPELDNALVLIQNQFEDEINNAIRSCEANIGRRNEPNQKPACDQLHRRWLFTERFIEKIRVNGCLSGSSYIGAYATVNGAKEASYSGSEAATAATTLNKRAANSDLLCQCPVAATLPPSPGASSSNTAVAPSGGVRVALGAQCPLAPVPPPPIPPPVPPPPAPPAAVCPGSGVAIAVPTDGPFNFCACPRDNNVRVPIGQNVVCPPTVPPPPPPTTTCSQPQGIENFDYETCRCRTGSLKTKNDGRKVCEGDNTGLFIAGGIGLAALIAILATRNGGDPKCAAGGTYNPVTRSCACAAIACDLTTNNYNSTSCLCTPKTTEPPTTCPNPAQTNVGGVCQCVSAGLCTGAQKVYDYEKCLCTDKPEPPKCENGSLAPDGQISKCPIKCPDNSYVTPPATCPPTTPPGEGGNGNSCPSGDCNGGAPGTGR